MSEELNAPLGGKRRRTKTSGAFATWRHWPWTRTSAALVVGIGIGIGLWIAFTDDPMGGRPAAEVPLSSAQGTNPIAIEMGEEFPAGETPPTSGQPAIGTAPSFITLGDDGVVATGDRLTEFGSLPELVETTQMGPLPRLGDDGVRPFEAYARPSISLEAAGGRPLIGIVMTGLGINEATTREAIRALPGAVTLAFAPYGTGLEQLTAQAREAGHELMLEVPLEPFDYPQNDPGPHTLLADNPPRENLEKLYWVLGRMGGYTGLINHMGARFTASAADFGPVMEELSMRGLAYLDDGSSNRSLAAQLARQNQVPFARIDRELDTNPSSQSITAELAALEAQARERGYAIGSITALPVSIRTLSQWADGLDEAGVVLVPISALSRVGDSQ